MSTTKGSVTTGAAAADRWHLDHDGHHLQVETARVGWMRVVRLYVDGVQEAEVQVLNQARFPYGDTCVQVVFDLLGLLDGQAARCVLFQPGRGSDSTGANGDTKEDGGGKGGRQAHSFTAPEGTRAARRERLAREHPALYASRHVVAATAKVVLGILGVSALISAVVRLLLSYLPRPDVDLPDIDLPDIDPPLPDIPWPDLDLPDVTPPGWLQAILGTAEYWLPILIAVGVAVHEVDRRGKQDRAPGDPAAPDTTRKKHEKGEADAEEPGGRRP